MTTQPDPSTLGTTAADRSEGIVVTRSEERLRTTTQWVPRERVRVHREVVSEDVTVTVTVRREVLRISREPLDGAAGPTDSFGSAGSADSAGVHGHDEVLEVVLREERPVAGVEVVPVERVRIGVQTLTEEQVVTGTVREEQIDLTSDPRGGAPSGTRGDLATGPQA